MTRYTRGRMEFDAFKFIRLSRDVNTSEGAKERNLVIRFKKWVIMHQSIKPTSTLLFDCMFDDYGIAEHHSHDVDSNSHLDLPDMYAVCIINNLDKPEKMEAALMIRTNIPCEQNDFLDGIAAIIAMTPRVQAVTNSHCRLLTFPVDTEAPALRAESQALYVFRKLWSEHQTKQILRIVAK
jgi:hypothetical protein